MSVFIIAEIGVNHGGNLVRALELVDTAVAVGADAVKFQAFTADRLEPPGERRELLRSLEFDEAQLDYLARHCAIQKIEFMATPFDVEWLGFLHGLGMRRLKIASSSITNMELLHAAAALKWEAVYLSTGAATDAEVSRAFSVFNDTWVGAFPTLLHCVSSYPTTLRDCQLWRLYKLEAQYKLVTVGFSSHCPSIWPAAAAVAMGAAVIEQHLTLSRQAPGPDHASSLEPSEFAEMVRAVRTVETAIGFELEHSSTCEDAVRNIRKERDAWRATCSATAVTGG